MLSTASHQTLFQGTTFGPRLAEPGSDDDNTLDSVGDTVLNRLGDMAKRGGNHRQINRCGYISQAGIGGMTEYLGSGRVDQIDVAREAAVDQLFSRNVSPFVRCP